MISEKMLLRNLSLLQTLFEGYAADADSEDISEVFLSASRQCEKIITEVTNGDISKACTSWQALQYYADDSIGFYKDFSSKYSAISYKIINFGLQ